jgi:hypothetical protein
MNSKQKRLIELAAEIVAFQAPQAPFTVRNGLQYMKTDLQLQQECPHIFGMSFNALEQGMITLVDLDKNYKTTRTPQELGYTNSPFLEAAE